MSLLIRLDIIFVRNCCICVSSGHPSDMRISLCVYALVDFADHKMHLCVLYGRLMYHVYHFLRFLCRYSITLRRVLTLTLQLPRKKEGQ